MNLGRFRARYLTYSCIIGLFALLHSNTDALSQDFCGIALKEKAYDVKRSRVRHDVVVELKNDVCSRSYESVSSAKQVARASGFGLEYKGIELDFSGSKRMESGEYKVSESNFCKATASDLREAYDSDYESQVAGIAVEAWLECVRSSSENQLFIEYASTTEGDAITGSLNTTANNGTLVRTITGVSIVGPNAGDVTCEIASSVKVDGTGLSEPIPITAGRTNFSCSKTGDGELRIAFQTNVGATDFATLLSKAALAKEAEVSASKEIKKLTKHIKSLESKINTVGTNLRIVVAAMEDLTARPMVFGSRLADPAYLDKICRQAGFKNAQYFPETTHGSAVAVCIPKEQN